MPTVDRYVPSTPSALFQAGGRDDTYTVTFGTAERARRRWLYDPHVGLFFAMYFLSQMFGGA